MECFAPRIIARRNCSRLIRKINRIIQAIRKHIVAQQALSSGNKYVRVEESAPVGIVISGLEVIEPGFSVVNVAFGPNSGRFLLPTRGGKIDRTPPEWAVYRYPSGTDWIALNLLNPLPKIIHVITSLIL